MAYRTILVHLQLGQPHTALLHLAARLGDRFGARLIGVAASQPMQALIAEGCANGLLIEDEIAELAREMAVAKDAFHAALGQHPNGATWHARNSCLSIAWYVAQIARSADLILTDAGPGGYVDAQRQMQVSELLMCSGRPVLIAPASAVPLLFAHALLAWDDSRECRRAATDALPLLREAGLVSVMQVADDADHAARIGQLCGVVEWLASHGVGARPLLLSAGGGPLRLGELAIDHACDLVVAGAYGHSRLREWALGGVSRALIAQQQVTVMLSH